MFAFALKSIHTVFVFAHKALNVIFSQSAFLEEGPLQGLEVQKVVHKFVSKFNHMFYESSESQMRSVKIECFQTSKAEAIESWYSSEAI